MPRQRRMYSTAEKAEALALVAERGGQPGAVSYAARQLGIPVRTVNAWAEQHRDSIQAAVLSVEAQILPRLWDLQQRLLDQLEKKIPDMSGKDAVIAYGILQDKIAQSWVSQGQGMVNVAVRLNVPAPVINVEEWHAIAAAVQDGTTP